MRESNIKRDVYTLFIVTTEQKKERKKKIEKYVCIRDALMTIRYAYVCVHTHTDRASTSIAYTCMQKKEHLFTHIFTRVKASISRKKSEREREKKKKPLKRTATSITIYQDYCTIYSVFLSLFFFLGFSVFFFGHFFIFILFFSIGDTLRLIVIIVRINIFFSSV